MDATIATEIYGVYSGVVAVLINAPIVLASSIGIALVPNVSSKQNNQEQNRQKAFDDAILFASIITIPSALVFSLFSYPFGYIFIDFIDLHKIVNFFCYLFH